MKGVVALLVAFSIGLVSAVDARTWISTDGKSKIEAGFVSADYYEVVLKTAKGREIKVQISKLCREDRAYIEKQRNNPTAEASAPETQAPSLTIKKIERNPPKNLPYELGKVVGPIEAGPKAHYFLYLPTTLTEGRKAPMMFYTNAGGGFSVMLQKLVEGAEVNGWVIAMSVESRNNHDTEDNKKTAKESVEHILKTLPVDEDRLYFTGNSGGGAMAFYNYDNLDGYGLMPVVGYNPGVSTPQGDAFIINGGADFNRYTSAAARKDIGKTAIHRLHGGGHGGTPGWLRCDGMVWLEGKYQAREGKKDTAVRDEYVWSVLGWINELKRNEAHRAYYWAQFLKEEIDLTGEESKVVDEFIAELGKDQNNTLYVEGLREIDELSQDHLSNFGTGSKMRYLDDELVSDCSKLLQRYSGVPVIDETLNAMMEETGALKGH